MSHSELPAGPLPDAELDRALCAMPKTELHLHLEGALRWSTVRELHPEGARLPEHPPWQGVADPFADFKVFLDAFQSFMRPASGTPEAVERYTCEVLLDLAAQNVRYAELIVSVAFHRDRGLSQREVLEAVASGRREAQRRSGITASIIYGMNRHLSPQRVHDDLLEALDLVPNHGEALFSGIDLQGDERAARTEAFAPSFRAAAEAGLKLRAHCGELRGPNSVREVIELLGVRHLSHGVRAFESADLTRDLERGGTWLHLCPTSNVSLHVYPDFTRHPLRRLFLSDCKITVNSDDPLLFGATITDEYRTLARCFGFTPAELAEVAQAGFEASGLPAAAQTEAIEEIGRLLD